MEQTTNKDQQNQGEESPLHSKEILQEKIRMLLHSIIQVEQALRFHSLGQHECFELEGIELTREQVEGVVTLTTNRLIINLHATRYKDSYMMDMQSDPSADIVYQEVASKINEILIRIHEECQGLPFPLAMTRQEIILLETETYLTDFIWKIYIK